MMNRQRLWAILATFLLATALLPHQIQAAFDPATAQKLVSEDGIIGTGRDEFGQSLSISLSADGSTVLIGARHVNAAYIFTRAADGTWTQEAKLTTANGAADAFGLPAILSADGRTAFIGQQEACTCNTGTAKGIVYVFTRFGNAWTQQAELTPLGGQVSEFFGGSIEISTDTNTALITDGGYNDFEGAVFVFTRSGNKWVQQARLTPSPNDPGFGKSIALSADGRTALVGSNDVTKNEDDFTAYIFIRSGNMWKQQDKFSTGVNKAGRADLSADGNTVIITNINDDVVYVFSRSGSTWKQQGKITTGGNKKLARAYLSVDGNTVITTNAFEETAYVFSRSDNTWNQQAELVVSYSPNSELSGGFFDLSDYYRISLLSADGNTALIGAADGKNETYVFIRSGNKWHQQAKLNRAGSWSLSADGNTILIGVSDADVYILTSSNRPRSTPSP